MRADVIRLKCHHVQDYGDTYAALQIEDGVGFAYTLVLPMWQYQESYSPKMLENLAFAINKHFNWPKKG